MQTFTEEHEIQLAILHAIQILDTFVVYIGHTQLLLTNYKPEEQTEQISFHEHVKQLFTLQLKKNTNFAGVLTAMKLAS